MSLPVLTGFAGVLAAAAVTGMLAGRCVRRPRVGLIAWAAAMLGLAIALGAASLGFAGGFGPATFRVVQVLALALVPLWLAWGLVELVAANESIRFGIRLAAGALTVVAAVILATDPLSPVPFGKSWPLAAPHFQPVARYALDAVQAAAILALVTGEAAAAAQARNARRGQAAPTVAAPPGLTVAAPAGLAVLATAGMRFSLPAGAAYPLLGMVTAALVWFAASRLARLPGRDSLARADSGAQAQPEAGPAAAAARPYGRILIFTLLQDRVADFDRLAGQTAEEVRSREPDTLVYVIHLVPNAPLQRIFYELYRDRPAFDRHENQPYMQRFVAERRSSVLATNVIELRLACAKVAPRPRLQPGSAQPAIPQPVTPEPRLQPLPLRSYQRRPSPARRDRGS